MRLCSAVLLTLVLLGAISNEVRAQTEQRRNEALDVQRAAANAKVGLFGASLESDQLGRIAVTEVAPNSPASAAGIQVGDRILSVEGRVPRTLTELVDNTTKLVATKRPGEQVAVKLVRNQNEQTVLVLIPETSTAGPLPPPSGNVPGGATPVVLGVAVKERGPNVVVTQVVPNDPAFKAGIQPNDVIQAIGRQPVTSYSTLVAAIKPYAIGEQVPVQIMRGKQAGIMTVTVAPGSGGTDVVVASSDDIAEIVAEVKRLRAQLDQLTIVVQQLRQEVSTLRGRTRR